MTHASHRLALTLAPLALLAAGTASAHAGHDAGGGLLAGLVHPWLGVDHLLAMLAIGLWSVRPGGSPGRAVPWLVALGMLLGAGLAWGGMRVPGIETGIALSVLLAGLSAAALVKPPTALGAALVVAFMAFHGHAHGAEMPQGASPLTYLAGLLLASLVITHAGRGLGGCLMARGSRLGHVLGAVIALAGGGFLVMG